MTSTVRSMQLSRQLQRRAETLLPGGVDSPVRAFRAVGGEPPFVVRAEGAYLWDADGNRYLDYFGSWGPMILGHAAPQVVRAVQEAAARGVSFGASTPTEADLAEMVRQAFPSIEMLRFVSSGTEATMSAIRLARAFTGRKFFIKFEGCYHGHSDGLLVKAGSGVATLGIPGSAGVPEETIQHTIALPYNDIAAVEEAFTRYTGQIACVIVEPVVGNAGCIPPKPGYLEALRAITARAGTVLIFDEVMTGFRLALGGAQERYGIQPDMTCLGKILGGGLPCGAFGGRAEIMRLLAPLGPVYQAGTLSGNPLAMAAGIATVGTLIEQRDTIYPQLEQVSAAVAEGVAGLARQIGVAVTTNRVGSMFTWFFTADAVTDYDTASRSNTKQFAAFHNAMLRAGVWLPPSQFEAAFLGTAHGEEEIRATLIAAKDAMVAAKSA
ncbi:MAG TPA: glutamate-1-semialdehyde 2,1-aminomutase [Acidobacteriaceae bacterium]|nr:glutamate-1-semialdehyde 2,1-aminomutase [Acidobacteriaceae bacterium]